MFSCVALINELENVAIAHALQLEAARATPVLSGFTYGVMPICAVTLTFDL